MKTRVRIRNIAAESRITHGRRPIEPHTGYGLILAVAGVGTDRKPGITLVP